MGFSLGNVPVSRLGGKGGGELSLGGKIGASGACLICCGELISGLSLLLPLGGNGGGVEGMCGLIGSTGGRICGPGEAGL